MPVIHCIQPDGTTRRVEAATGRSVMEAAIRADVRGIDADCGGACACATCHVYVDDAFLDRLPPPDETEDEMLGFVVAERRRGSRLGCQIIVGPAIDGLVVRVPEAQS